MILFANQSSRPSGGVLKLRHYFEHALSLFPQTTKIYMPEDTPWTPCNLFAPHRNSVIHNIDWQTVSVMVISGWGWERFVPGNFHAAPPFQVIYLVQSFNKFRPQDSRFSGFANPAIRICVSEPLSTKLQNLGIANGPVHTIPVGIDVDQLQITGEISAGRDTDVLIIGLKNPQIGKLIAEEAKPLGIRVRLLTELLSREDFLQQIAHARIVICLPAAIEGFYLPALEAMALDSLVIVPQVIGNSYCIDGFNCIAPEYDVHGIIGAIKLAIGLSPSKSREMISNAKKTALEHNLQQERSAFQKILKEAVAGTTLEGTWKE